MAKKIKKFQGRKLTLSVRRRPGCSHQGLMNVDGQVFACALGRSGVVSVKREGDGGTPRGRFRLLWGYGRHSIAQMRKNRLPLHPITLENGWCDAVGDRNYNRPVSLPYPASHEVMQREDRLYDVVIVMDYNITRRMSRGGSAIFFHIAKEGFSPTEGCVAVSPLVMERLLKRLNRYSTIAVL